MLEFVFISTKSPDPLLLLIAFNDISISLKSLNFVLFYLFYNIVLESPSDYIIRAFYLIGDKRIVNYLRSVVNLSNFFFIFVNFFILLINTSSKKLFSSSNIMDL